MDDRRYHELLEAILDLRGAAELGFEGINRRFDDVNRGFDDVYHRLDGLDRRFGALESRMEQGFNDVSVRFEELEQGWERRFGALEARLDRGFGEVAIALNGIRDRLTTVEQEL